jgi:lipoprotein-anchoring transpeptidase ErfK/SrfK
LSFGKRCVALVCPCPDRNKMKIISIAILSSATMFASSVFAMPTLTEEAINSATYEEWRERRGTAPAVLEVDPQSGEVEASDNRSAEVPPASEGADGAQVPVPGQPNVVVETPQESTDIPDEAHAQITVDPDALEEAEKKAEQSQDKPDPFLIRLQILLARVHVSPGVIDGFLGENTRKAIAVYEAMRGLPADGQPDAETWAILVGDSAEAMQAYEITADDVNGRYVERIPDDYAELAKAEWLGYRDVVEMLAEKFHIDDDVLRLLNPNANFTAVGSKVLVPALGSEPTTAVARVVVDKSDGELRAYDGNNIVVFFSPAMIAMGDTPSPHGTLTVVSISPEPTHSFVPDKAQKPGNAEPMTIPPGPNSPVGNMWIDLSNPACGIHGTADPEMIGKSRAHGCVGLANWDVDTLAALVKPGRTVVEFRD